MYFSRRQIIMGLSAMSIGLMPVHAQTKTSSSRLLFGLISPRAPEETRANWEPFVQRMGLAIGQSIEVKVYKTSEDVIKGFAAKEIDLAWVGNVIALELVERDLGNVFAQLVTQDGSVGYESILVVHRDSPIDTLDEVLQQAKRLRFSDGDPKSTSGYLVPLYFAFHKSGVNDTKSIFKSVEFGSHQQNMKKVAEGTADVATANNEELGFFQHDFPDKANNLKIVWKSPVIPQSPLVWKTNLPPELKKSIKKFVFEFGVSDPDEKKILLAVNGLSRFRPSTNRQLVRISDLEMFKIRQAINNDKSLSVAERTKRINEAIVRGSRVELQLKRVDS